MEVVQRPLGAQPPPALWRQRSFRRLWAAQTASVFGDQISLLALPLVGVLTLDASAAQMGILTALAWLPHLLFSLFVGLWVDRRERRGRIMIAADLVRAAVLGSVPLAAAFGLLTIEQLYAAAFLVGTFSVFFDLSYSSFFVAVVPRAQIVDANSRLFTSRALSYVGGPTLAGFLVQILTAPFAILADAFSFVVSALFLKSIDVVEPPVEARDGVSLWRRLREGFSFLFGDELLRASLACVATVNFFNFVFHALFILFATRELGLEPGLLGVALGIGAAGGVLGALVAGRIARRIGLGPAIALGSVVFTVPLALIPAAGGPTPVVAALVGAAELMSGFGVMVFDINLNSLQTYRTPQRIRARAGGAHRFVNYGTRPIGAALGGALGAVIGLRPALWIGVLGAALGVLWLVFSPVVRLREAPAEAI